MSIEDYLIGTREELETRVSGTDYDKNYHREANVAIVAWLLSGYLDYKFKVPITYTILPSAILAVDVAIRKLGDGFYGGTLTPGLIGLIRQYTKSF